jgi:ABC-type polysaccharide/polyol phosphate export permease
MNLLHNAVYLAWADTKARYKKSVLGPFWPTLTNLLGVLGLSLVWAGLMQQDMNNFVPQLAVGLIIWQLISGVLSDGPGTFSRQAAMIKNVAIPSWFFACRLLARHLINLMHNALIVVGVMVYFQLEITVQTWMFVPGLLLVVLNLYWIMHFLGLTGARFRDIEHLVQGVVPMLFFLSPVIYRADRLPPGLNIVWLNPLSYMIEAVRSPILGAAPHPSTYPVLLSMLVLGALLTWWYQSTKGKNLAFWV